MKRHIATTAAIAAALAAFGSHAHAQSSITLFGTLDAALRYSNHQGATGKESLSSLLGSGLTPSRLGWVITEDLGDGLRALANFEYRFTADNGIAEPGGQFFQQSFVGLQSPTFGRVTLGRQYNVLFDAAANTFSAFKPIGPFLNAFKPEISVALGARNDNQLKYALLLGNLQFEAQYAFGEGTNPSTTTVGKAYGAMLRYAMGPVAVSGAYLQRRDGANLAAKAALVGVGYHAGDVYLNASYARNEFDDGLNSAVLLVGSGAENAITAQQPLITPLSAATRTRHRTVWSVGGSYALTPQSNLGLQYWRLDQSYHVAGSRNVSGDFYAVLGNYLLSKQTDIYAGLEYTRLDTLQLTNTPTGAGNGRHDRTSAMLGLRYRF